METDTFFWRLFKQFPQAFFTLVGQPPERAALYRYESVEIKKSLRVDGVFAPLRSGLPVYFAEVQFRKSWKFYANLFAKVFSYLDAHPEPIDWSAAAIFESRRTEPKFLDPFEDLLVSKRVTRIYLDEYSIPADPSPGLGILQLVSVPQDQIAPLVERLRYKAEHEIADGETARRVIELVEELLIRRFTQLNREEVRKMFQLEDIRKSKVWQEAEETGAKQMKQKVVRNSIAKGMSTKEIAALLEISVKEVRRLAKDTEQ